MTTKKTLTTLLSLCSNISTLNGNGLNRRYKMYAHCYKAPKGIKGYQLIINNSARPIGGITTLCPNMKAVRALVKEHGATPYNF